MLSKEELTQWFWNKFNSCYLIKDPNIKGNFHLYYNKGYARKKRINVLLGNKLDIKIPSVCQGTWFFELDYRNGYLVCDDEIWSFFENNYSSYSNHVHGYSVVYNHVRELIKEIIKDDDRLNKLEPFCY